MVFLVDLGLLSVSGLSRFWGLVEEVELSEDNKEGKSQHVSSGLMCAPKKGLIDVVSFYGILPAGLTM